MLLFRFISHNRYICELDFFFFISFECKKKNFFHLILRDMAENSVCSWCVSEFVMKYLSLYRFFLVGRHFDATTMNQLRAFIFGIRHVIAHARTLTLAFTLKRIEM